MPNLSTFPEINKVRERSLINMHVRARLQEEEACLCRKTAATYAAQSPVNYLLEPSFSWLDLCIARKAHSPTQPNPRMGWALGPSFEPIGGLWAQNESPQGPFRPIMGPHYSPNNTNIPIYHSYISNAFFPNFLGIQLPSKPYMNHLLLLISLYD
jgi:hypothetical protein